MGPGKLAKSNAEQVAQAADRRESRHCLTMINGRCAQIPAIAHGLPNESNRPFAAQKVDG
jgi:hypothetical protein